MRTTVTLDTDTDEIVKALMAAGQMTFKQALNEAIRRGTRTVRPDTRFITPTYDLGHAGISLTKALSIADAFEDDELSHKLSVGK